MIAVHKCEDCTIVSTASWRDWGKTEEEAWSNWKKGFETGVLHSGKIFHVNPITNMTKRVRMFSEMPIVDARRGIEFWLKGDVREQLFSDKGVKS